MAPTFSPAGHGAVAPGLKSGSYIEAGGESLGWTGPVTVRFVLWLTRLEGTSYWGRI